MVWNIERRKKEVTKLWEQVSFSPFLFFSYIDKLTEVLKENWKRIYLWFTMRNLKLGDCRKVVESFGLFKKYFLGLLMIEINYWEFQWKLFILEDFFKVQAGSRQVQGWDRLKCYILSTFKYKSWLYGSFFKKLKFSGGSDCD